MSPEHFEVLIVGGGKAGKTLAIDLATSGRRVALVERGMIGGSCINVACIPTKAMVACARTARAVAQAHQYGIVVPGWHAELAAVVAYQRAVVARMVELNSNNLHGALGNNFILGEARFTGPRSVLLQPAGGGSDRQLTADKLFINLGTRSAMPTIPGLAESGPLTSESIQNLQQLPEHLLVLGGGYIGVEFGQMFARLGSRVTIVQRGPRLLPAEDQDVSDAVAELFRDDKIEVWLGAETLSVQHRPGETVRLRVRIAGEEQEVEGTHVLAATGRTPMTRDVGLETAGVELDERGFVRVNDRLETTAPDTWALGDCAGSVQFTHVSLDDYRIVKANVFSGGNRTTLDRLIPSTVFIDPELGRVGLTQREARRLGRSVRVAKLPLAAVPRAQTMSQTYGFLKAIVDSQSDLILGFAMLGPDAGEVTAVVQMAMLGGMPYTALRDGILAHPTMAEGLNLLLARVPEAGR
jgi:probable pyridine nucleotide-disulfide oxidoreductase